MRSDSVPIRRDASHASESITAQAVNTWASTPARRGTPPPSVHATACTRANVAMSDQITHIRESRGRDVIRDREHRARYCRDGTRPPDRPADRTIADGDVRQDGAPGASAASILYTLSQAEVRNVVEQSARTSAGTSGNVPST